jgi:hypothetical protein
VIESVVKSALQTEALIALVGTRVYPTTFQQKDGGLPQWPALRYTMVDAVSSVTIDGTDDESTDDSRVQVDIVANTLREVNEILPLVIASMQATDPPCYRDGLRKTFDDETRTHRAIVDFIFTPSTEQSS